MNVMVAMVSVKRNRLVVERQRGTSDATRNPPHEGPKSGGIRCVI
jgi:hypothetical protein